MFTPKIGRLQEVPLKGLRFGRIYPGKITGIPLRVKVNQGIFATWF
jgi:hypothetical protein